MKLKLDPKRLSGKTSSSKKTYFVKTVHVAHAPQTVSTDVSNREPTTHAAARPENTSWSF